ncbi:50S ribosomal protein L1 [Candidatus Marinamargulisbacteria bacterium SCGC AG-343-D04]|nr:50S ribosomal protein L1 [Candidatus Marinamargulisbacteria bacterium SCGC AG-343-D04]
MKTSKLFKEKKALIEENRDYSPIEAFKLLKKVKYSKYDESVEVHFRLGIDPKHADQQLRGTIVLPKGIGKEKRVLAIAEGDNEKLAQDAGADFVGSDDLIEKIQGGWFDFDVLITTPDMMRKLGKLGRALGSKGLMPNPKLGTVTKDIGKTVEEFKSGKFEYRNDKDGILHVLIGKTSFSNEDLAENFEFMYDFLLKVKPAKSKGTYFKSIALCSTQSPSIFIEPIKVKWDKK